MPLKNSDEPDSERTFSRGNVWSGIKLILVVILWLGLMVLTYYTLLTLPAVLFVSIWIYLLISRRNTKHKPKELGWQNQENDEKNNKNE